MQPIAELFYFFLTLVMIKQNTMWNIKFFGCSKACMLFKLCIFKSTILKCGVQ
jgi:hypothetical protein